MHTKLGAEQSQTLARLTALPVSSDASSLKLTKFGCHGKVP